MLDGWSSPEPAYRPDEGPELADWPEPPVGGGPGFAAGEWSGPDGGFVPQAGTAADEWAGPDNGAAPHDAVAADDWARADAGLLPGAVLGQGEWTVRAPEADLDAEPGPAADPGLPPASPPALNLWPGPEAALPTETPASPAAEQPAGDGDPDQLPRRVESEFNVWGRRNPATAPPAGPAASPAGTGSPATAPTDTAPTDTAPTDVAPTDTAVAEPATPLTADPDHPAGSTPSTRDWVRHAASSLRDADLLEPVDDEAEQDPILRPPAPRRRSGPDPGWNPDSEEDWLRVLRGLRASEDS
jgi:hypothetical protein